MINWREKFRAFGIHFAATLVLALMSAGLFFFVWYPDPFHEMVGGSKLFLLVVACDLVLGPLLSLVIYNSRKSRRELYLDYSLVAAVQVAALAYGMFVAFSARPAYVVFNFSRLDVVAANDFDKADLQAATSPEFRKLPRFGPELVAAYVRPAERNEALMQALSGKDVSLRPQFFVPYDTAVKEVIGAAQSLDVLEEKHPEVTALISARLGNDADVERLKWLPVKHKRGFWTTLLDPESGRPIHYLPLDPY